MRTESSVPGIYMNEDGDWWVAVEDVPSFAAARAWVVGHLSYDIPSEGRLRYTGRHVAQLCDHEYGSECEPGCGRNVLAYHFEERRYW